MTKGRNMDETAFIEERLVDNPLTGYAQWRAEIEEHGAAYAGKITAQVNLVTLMGGFVRFYGNASQQRACTIYRATYEAAQVGGARAVDPSREPVDGGWLNPEAVFINGADARKQIIAIDEHLGRMDANRLRFVVVGEWGPTSYARHFYHLRTPNSQAVSKAKAEVRGIADNVAAFLKLSTEGGPSRLRAEGERPTIIEEKAA